MNLNCRRLQNNSPYIEVENVSLVNVTFSVEYTSTHGVVRIKNSKVLTFNQMEKIYFPKNSSLVIVRIYNASITPHVILKEGKLTINRTTCFEVNGTQATARVREVDC